MKTTKFKALIKEAVKEAIQEELKEILLEAIKSPKHVISEGPSHKQTSQVDPIELRKEKMKMYQDMIMETQTPKNREFQVPSNFNSSEGELPEGELSFEMISNLTGL